MIKVLIGSLLIATTVLGQTTPQTPKGSAAKSTSASATSATKMNKPMAASATKPLPQTTRKQKLQSGDNAIPSYRMEKDAGIRKGMNRYPAEDTKKKKNQ
jgi:hypothetical protein